MTGTESNAPRLGSTVWSLTSVCIFFTGLRIYLRLKFRGGLWWDDWILLSAMLFLLLQATFIQLTIVLGFGQHLSVITSTHPENIFPIILYGQVGVTFVRLAANAARISFAVTLLRIASSRRWWRRFVWFSIVTLLAVMVPAILFLWVSCRPYKKNFDMSIPGVCIDDNVGLGYSIFEAAYNAWIDFVLVFLPWNIISGLKIRRTEKIGACLAMSIGVFSGAVTIVKAAYINKVSLNDFSYDGTDVTIWSIVEPATLIIAASIPALRVLIMKKTKQFKKDSKLVERQEESQRSEVIDEIQLTKVDNRENMESPAEDDWRGDRDSHATTKAYEEDSSNRSVL
ncbi:hypothetical protein SAMD00023353_8400270 [Rosellinia necatrix]|uniref:Rhodopsin domain-containing protein n=1 Tax=Rosellinia necatrix TaxID=77044 RepID=A0A1W2TW84_ROSNE|nr:hypothetical protein SAMD00023353_8400270 [Rosellinia necatrix]